jgi:tight adherence protein B
LSWALPLIAVVFLVLLIFEFKAVRLRRNQQRIASAWPKFEELYISALESGVSIPEAFRFSQDFGLEDLKPAIDDLVAQLDRGERVQASLRTFGQTLKLGFADLFVEIVDLAHRTGSQNLISALQEHALEVRQEVSTSGEVAARTSAILTVAKLGLLAPWVLLAVLCFNERNRESFSTSSGGFLLVGGFAISFIAFRLVVLAGQTKPVPRVFGLVNAR